ncbi:MAG: hypothetical protein NC408_05960 [Candidatus Gastranaerophilales bacterium]|nr:hypothetical protein [Candidatus Gastranaerophilales bacterium]MCM1072417.1 hypothetical protein [Bacteroides sp.]
MEIQAKRINNYLKSISPQIRDTAFPLEKVKLPLLEGIQSDITVFKNTSLEEITFLTKWFQVLNLARGCREQCTFCLRNALAPLKENSKQISSILWDDLTRFTGGIAKLNERLGFNILQGNSHITLFEDANLPAVQIKDTEGTLHSVRDSVKEIYEKLGLPLVFVTAGWNPTDNQSQESAEELCRYIMQNPDCVKEFGISVNPFHSYNREFYTTKMANTLKTFLPLYKNGTEIGSILLKYNYPNGIETDNNGYEAASNLYKEIFSKLKILTGSTLENYDILKPENVTQHREDNYIENKGRGQRFFPTESIEKNNKKLFVESFRWLTMTPQEKREKAYNFTTKNIDINGQIYLITPSEQLIETSLRLNFINQDKTTAPIHSDIKFKKFEF